MKTTPSGSIMAPLLSWDIFMAFYHNLLLREDRVQQDLSALRMLSLKHQWAPLPFEYRPFLDQPLSAIVVTDASQQIVWASHHFEEMTGYNIEETLTRRPSFLQGAQTDPQSLQSIREAIRNRVPVLQQTVVNYKKNGEMYHCRLDIHPVLNFRGQLTHFIALETELAA
jgi:PAS domain S-box-containing protein